MITARNLTKKFGEITALSDLTLTISPGEFIFLTGPSGSGKTTLLRLVLRDLLPDSGSLIVNHHDLNKLKKKDLPQLRREIGTVFQDFKLLADQSIWENVSLPLEVRHLPQAQLDKAVKIALELVGLTDRTSLFPAQLSGGELQRAGLARAIVGKPQLILADEPTGNLDPKTARTIVKLLKDIHTELKTTIVMATHNADIVNLYSQRVVSLDRGKLIKDSPKGKYE
ncbi:ATP-binding cassette domain-containing protein [Candidatus Amesbacteria bacterium]|nr:ATP-binding cassette domain-containing protein [Candidatus Amesbacteria bacterium]